MEGTPSTPGLISNIGFFKKNIDALKSARPNVELKFDYSTGVGYEMKYLDAEVSGQMTEEYVDQLRAINGAIILNSFSLFEASFESHLLDQLDAMNLAGVQEKIVLKYIEDIRKISSEDKLAKEFEFITGIPIKLFLPDKQYRDYLLIKEFYVLRHLLIHGSALKIIYEQFSERYTLIRVDQEKNEFLPMLTVIEDRLGLKIQHHATLITTLLLHNNIVDLLVDSVLSVCSKFSQKVLKTTRSIPWITNYK